MREEDQEKEQQDREQQPSSVDRANDLINKAKDARNAYRGLKGARGAATATRGAAAVGQAAVATSEIWAPILLVFAVFIIIVVLISTVVSLISGGGTDQEITYSCSSIGGTCSATSTCQSPNTLDPSASCSATLPFCCAPAREIDPTVPDCATVDQRLKQDLNAKVVRGEKWECAGCASGYAKYPQTPTCEAKQDFWKTWGRLAKSASYAKRLKSVEYRAELFYNNSYPKSFGYTAWTYKTQLLNAIRIYSSSYPVAAFWVTHETQHMITKRDSRLENSFDVNYLKNNGDGSCYIGNYLKTYGCIGCSGISPIRESISEAVALYVYNKKGTIVDFKRQCPATYRWIRYHLFPDYEYF